VYKREILPYQFLHVFFVVVVLFRRIHDQCDLPFYDILGFIGGDGYKALEIGENVVDVIVILPFFTLGFEEPI